MKSPRYNDVSENPQTILRCHSRYSSPISIDLIIEILLRLPLKSIARCRCVSKLLASILVRLDFTDSFLASSLSRPQVLFACQKQYKNDGRKTPRRVWVICNPSTGQSFTLPKMKTRKRIWIRCFLGYDPIEKQHKALAMTSQVTKAEDHQVLTLGGTDKLAWRRIECGIPQYGYPGPHNICINGLLYFKAKAKYSSNGQDIIVCFDVRSEKYNFVKVTERAVHPEATLVNYNGKLASVISQSHSHSIFHTTRSFEMWVLQDSEKNEWSKHIYILPSLGKYISPGENLFFVGVTGADEIVLCPKSLFREPFYVYYYNLKRGTIRRVEIQGLERLEGSYRVDTFLNHVEDVKILK
ncbi:PREDICTED: F-box protein DOR-like [Brassica oleracea var. oleracea]|uniref:F-box protein DOR-like n=1 Tax=Brassica oleracea var. oleracea TaxID=109376 RepID=UPI0006A705FC|nr:PREDICTED: F-box protein DOR-like [Brassica oleracea var. oleracea]